MIELNKQQMIASNPNRGVSLIIAGAGTGKTSTMIKKIQNVIEHSIVKPEEILILTFSIKAAEDIRKKILTRLNPDDNIGFIGTFHSFSLKILKENSDIYLKHLGNNYFPLIIEKEEKERILKKLIMNKPERFLGFPVDTILNLSENLQHMDKNTINKLKSISLFTEISVLKESYANYKKKNNLIEFEDMIYHASEILEKYPALKLKMNNKYKYIFIDEYQDTSDNNFHLLSLLLPDKEKNLFLVGDDFQSIYKFRHSRVEYIVNAKKFFPEITQYKLTINYRSRKEIIKISNRFIQLNKFRTSKNISSYRGKGGKVKYHPVTDMHHEAEIIKEITASIPFTSTLAVLYRNNYQGDYLKNKLESVNRDKPIEFMTMHKSKGLEFDVVIIAGISDKIIPDSTSDIEEERRLFYVALTRARNELHLIFYKNSNNKMPRFVIETGHRK